MATPRELLDILGLSGQQVEVPRRQRKLSKVTLREIYVNFPHEVWKYEPIPPQPIKLKELKLLEQGLALLASARVKSATEDNKWYKTTIILRRRDKSEKWSWNLPVEFKCSCDAYRYYLAYAMYSRAGIVGRPSFWNKVPAIIRNPENKPQLCKHGVLLTNLLIRKRIIEGRILWDTKRMNLKSGKSKKK